MLKWKRFSVTVEAAAEELNDTLAGMSGKNRVIKFLATVQRTALVRLRVYRDADQFVDYDCDLITDEAPLIPMDIPLADGQLCKIGIYNGSGTSKTSVVAIGYEETG